MKPWWRSVTMIGGIALAMLTAAETVGVVPPGTGTSVAKIGAELSTLYGLRRAMGLDKSIFQSTTMWGGVGFAGVQALETAGVVPAGAGAQLAQVATGLVTLFGLRRAAG